MHLESPPPVDHHCGQASGVKKGPQQAVSSCSAVVHRIVDRPIPRWSPCQSTPWLQLHAPTDGWGHTVACFELFSKQSSDPRPIDDALVQGCVRLSRRPKPVETSKHPMSCCPAKCHGSNLFSASPIWPWRICAQSCTLQPPPGTSSSIPSTPRSSTMRTTPLLRRNSCNSLSSLIRIPRFFQYEKSWVKKRMR